MPGTPGGQKKLSYPLETELQITVSYHMLPGKPNHGPLQEQVHLLNGCGISPARREDAVCPLEKLATITQVMGHRSQVTGQ